jgi:arginine decarboxylase-like protein
MPIHRQRAADRRAILADLTCDSDGKVDGSSTCAT